MPCNLQPGDLAPPFRTQAVRNGEIVSDFTLEDAIRNAQYLLLVFYPSDFSFSCPSEVLQFAEKAAEFSSQLQCSIVCCSTDSAYTHLAWLRAPKSERGLGWTQQQAASDGSEAAFPVLLSDQTRETSEAYGVLTPDGKGSYRANFLIGPDRRICQATISDMPVGRCIEEVQRQLIEMRSNDGGNGGAIRRSARLMPGCSRPKLPDQMLMHWQQQQQQQQQQFCTPQQYQPPSAMLDQYSASCTSQSGPTAAGFVGGVGASPGYQWEPASFVVEKQIFSSLAVEAANLEKQAALLRVKDSEDRLAWMIAETEKLRMESDRLMADTERLKSEARRCELEAERLQSCHSSHQYAKCGGVDGGGVSARLAVPTAGGVAENCTWLTAGAAATGTGENYLGCAQPTMPPAPSQRNHHCQTMQTILQQQQRRQLQQLSRSHVCRRSNNAVSSHIGRKS